MSSAETWLPPQAVHEAVQWIRQAAMTAGIPSFRPKIGVILGSGLNGVLSARRLHLALDYAHIPYVNPTTVAGHLGRLELSEVLGVPVALMRGRFHLYEGYAPDRLAFPVRILHALGAETLIVTNAAGGLNPEYLQGDLMVLRDHIGLPTLAGQHPLIGPNDDAIGPRFTPMGEAYDPELIAVVHEIAARAAIKLREGVYIMVSGPTYETPAELRALRLMGADAVGMSTVPEVITARYLGMKVLGISCITNAATPEAAVNVTHAAVLQGAAATLPQLDRLLTEFLYALARKQNH